MLRDVPHIGGLRKGSILVMKYKLAVAWITHRLREDPRLARIAIAARQHPWLALTVAAGLFVAGTIVLIQPGETEFVADTIEFDEFAVEETPLPEPPQIAETSPPPAAAEMSRQREEIRDRDYLSQYTAQFIPTEANDGHAEIRPIHSDDSRPRAAVWFTGTVEPITDAPGMPIPRRSPFDNNRSQPN